MTLSSSLSAGVAGLQANATRLAVISDNIANASTNGYRRADVDFSALVIPGTQNTYTAGGVQASAFRDVGTPGTLISSSSSTDLAISGRGFLPVTDIEMVGEPANIRPFKLTATGGFARNEDGFLTTRSGLALTGWRTDGTGTLLGNVVRDGPASLEPVQVTPFLTTSDPTTAADLVVNLPASATDAGGSGDPFTSVIEYYDGVGRSNQLTVVYNPTIPGTGSSNAWTIDVFDSASATPATAVGSFDVTFDPSRTGQGRLDTVTAGAGTTYTAATGILQVTVDSGPIDLFIGGAGFDRGLTQIEAGFAPVAVEANGSPAGRLSRLEVDNNGFLVGIYDTGTQITLYQIPVVDVPNPNGLLAEDDQAFSLTSSSGAAFLYDANTGPVGGIQSFALQESTVDIARELTGLIQTQRAYSSNATVVQTVDEMLQETTNLKR
ncbi:MAG: flagellar hook-basal body complex protein [Pseudomonadota bacterium]